MSTHKYINKICAAAIIVTMLLTVVLMNGESLGIQAVSRSMGYETRLFDTSEVHTIEIVMDDWDSFLETCTDEEYSVCSVVIDNEAYKNVGIRAKGNTSLTQVASYGNDRYSFKLEFDHYDSTKSYYGLDKLSLNNIIQDNTYMKDYLTYQMMGDFGVDAPLCSYVYITVNGEDWGLYLAVEGVEESFLERNYGSDYGELYKPDSMSMGGGRGNGGGFDMEDWQSERADESSNEEAADETGGGMEMPQMPGGGQMNESEQPDGEMEMPQMPDGGQTEMPQMPDGGQMEMPQMPDGGQMEMPQMPSSGQMNERQTEEDSQNESGMPDFDSFQMPDTLGDKGFQMGGSMGSSDVSLIYTDDEYSSYQNIFDNAKTDISDADKDRLIVALKQLNEGEDIEEVVNIEEVIRYFVVHNFVCNFDSYTGSMIHNYYLYEKDGQLSMIPWDYNLAFGGFQGAQDAAALVNYPIDTPVSGGDVDSRPMLAWIFADEEYTELYHQYFEEFITEYFDSGYFAEMIESVQEMISPYVEKDPTKFCTYEEFETGISTLKEFCLLRAESIKGQLDGTIASTSDGQAQDEESLIDAAGINISDMGTMNNGGGMSAPGNKSGMNDGVQGGKGENGFPDMTGENGFPDMKGENDFPDMAGDSDFSDMPDGNNFQTMPDNQEFPDMPDSSQETTVGLPGTQSSQSTENVLLFGISVVVLLAGLLIVVLYKRV